MQLNGNNAYVEWDGVVLNLYWANEITSEHSGDTEDITAGSGATHVQRAGKLIDATMGLYIIMDNTAFNSYKDLLQPTKIAYLVWGPEGSNSNKPKFEGKMILTGVNVSQTIDKAKIGFEVSFEQADKPLSTLTGDLAGVFA